MRAKDRELVTAAIVEHIRRGCTVEVACQAAGVATSTFRDWRREDASLSVALKKAMADWEASCIQQIAIAGTENKQWQALAWLLERRYPKRYGKRVIPIVSKELAEDTGVLVRVPKPSTNPDVRPA